MRIVSRRASLVALGLVTLLASVLVIGCGPTAKPQGESDSHLSYDQVVSSGTIRAAYINYPPGCIVDTATGEVKGIFPELLAEIGKNAKLKVEFTEEVGYGTMIEGLNSKRYDIVASPIWANAARGRAATSSKPVYFTAFGIWVRADETRFTADDNWKSVNSPDVRIAALDGSLTFTVAKTQFPNAQIVSHPDLSSPSELFLDVVTGKADVAFAEPEKGIDFSKTNPDKVKNIAKAKPLRIFPNIFLMRKKESQLKAMIDAGITELQISGFLDALLAKYEKGPDIYYPAVRSYAVPNDAH